MEGAYKYRSLTASGVIGLRACWVAQHARPSRDCGGRKTCWVELSLPRRVESREEMASAVSAWDTAKPIREETRLAQTASSRPGHGGRGQQFV